MNYILFTIGGLGNLVVAIEDLLQMKCLTNLKVSRDTNTLYGHTERAVTSTHSHYRSLPRVDEGFKLQLLLLPLLYYHWDMAILIALICIFRAAAAATPPLVQVADKCKCFFVASSSWRAPQDLAGIIITQIGF